MFIFPQNFTPRDAHCISDMTSRDESNLVMKVMIVKDVMTGDVSPVAIF